MGFFSVAVATHTASFAFVPVSPVGGSLIRIMVRIRDSKGDN